MKCVTRLVKLDTYKQGRFDTGDPADDGSASSSVREICIYFCISLVPVWCSSVFVKLLLIMYVHASLK